MSTEQMAVRIQRHIFVQYIYVKTNTLHFVVDTLSKEDLDRTNL